MADGPAVTNLALLRELASGVDTTAICDGDRAARVMSGELRCRSRNMIICGPAVTVRCQDDFFGVIQAIEHAGPGEVVVVDGGGREIALGGELFARAALGKGLAGIIVDGGYRDLDYVSACHLPIYSRHITPRAGTAVRLAAINEPVACGGVPVVAGDIVIADRGGIIVLDPATAAASLVAAEQVKASEARVIARMDQGATLGECLNVNEHGERLARGEQSSLRFTV